MSVEVYSDTCMLTVPSRTQKQQRIILRQISVRELRRVLRRVKIHINALSVSLQSAYGCRDGVVAEACGAGVDEDTRSPSSMRCGRAQY